MPPKTAAPRIVVLKSSQLFGDLICNQIKMLWRNADVHLFRRGFDALDSIQATMPDMFVTGVKLEDMDGLEHLEPFIERLLPVLIVTSRKDARTLSLLREVRYNGIVDVHADGVAVLNVALNRVLDREMYISRTFEPHVKPPKNITLESLTPKEEMVLSVIGDGSDDQQAAERLKISRHTVNTHRKAIMSKARLRHKGELVVYAMRHGFVDVTPHGVTHPGFQRIIRELEEPKAGEDSEAE